MSSGFNGFLIMNKEIKRHEYFTDIKTFHLFFWLLSDANFKEGNCNGILVKRGQKLTSVNSLIIETGLTLSEVKTALKKLIKSNHILANTTNKNTLLTVVKYEYYVSSNESVDKPMTNERQTNDKPMTTIEVNNKINKEISKERERVNSSLSHFDFLILNFEKEVLELETTYKLKINDWNFCIEKFNNHNHKEVSVLVLKKWLVAERNPQTNNSNNSNQNNDLMYRNKNGKISGIF